MSFLTQLLVSVLASGTLFIQAACLVLLILLIAGLIKPKNKIIKKLKGAISDNYVVIILVITSLATAGSLALSEIVNFAPCKLCWYQRAVMYPQAVIAFIALMTNDIKIKKYILPLSIIGLVIATYHILLQMFPSAFQCSDELAKCSAVQFAQFGFITIPVMAFSAFLLIILVSLTGEFKDVK